MRTLERCASALWLSVASSASFCARDLHKCLMPLCIGAFCIIFLRNVRLLIGFLVRLICYMVLPHYCAVRLKEMYFNFTAYIYFYIYYLFSMNVFYNNTKSNISFFFTRFSRTLIHFSLFPNTFFSLILDLIKWLCTHDFSIVTFTTELSTNLVYKSIFIID